MSLPSCNEPGMNDFEKQFCRKTKSQMKGIEKGPVHHSATFRQCAALYDKLSTPQKLSLTFDEAVKDGNFQRTHCASYMNDFFLDRTYHDRTGKWLTGYVDYGMHNGLNEPAKPDPTDALLHTVHPHVTKPSHSFLDEVHFSLLGYTFGPVVSWAVIIGGVLVVYWYFHR